MWRGEIRSAVALLRQYGISPRFARQTRRGQRWVYLLWDGGRVGAQASSVYGLLDEARRVTKYM